MKILVTGGAGYIGSTLVPLLLANGHRVRVLDSLLFGGGSLLGVWSHPGFEFIRGDLRIWQRASAPSVVWTLSFILLLSSAIPHVHASRTWPQSQP